MKANFYLMREREIVNKRNGYLKQFFYLFTTSKTFEWLFRNPYPTLLYYREMMMKKRSKWYANYKNYIYPLKFVFKNNLGLKYDKQNSILYFKVKSGLWVKLPFRYYQMLDKYGNPIQVSSVLVYPDIRLQVYKSNFDEKFYDIKELVYPFIVRYNFNRFIEPISYIPKKGMIIDDIEQVVEWKSLGKKELYNFWKQ